MRRNVQSIERPDGSLLLYYFLSSLILGPLFFLLFVPRFFKYKTLEYDFDNDGISMAWGMLWRTEISVSYSRIQDIHISRGLLERWLGLATIKIQTASGSSAAELEIVGLADYEGVRDFLYSRMRGGQHDRESSDQRIAADGGEASQETARALLVEIRDELRQVRTRLESGGE